VKADRTGATLEGTSANLTICAGTVSSDAPLPKGVIHSPSQFHLHPPAARQMLSVGGDAAHPGRSDPHQRAPH
jgi:hypothetical protein